MPKEITPTTSSHETPNRKLAYDLEFRNMLRENPAIIKSTIELMDKALSEYDPPDITIHGKIIRFQRETGKWLQERRSHVLGEDGKIQFDPAGHIITRHVGWEPITIIWNRGTFLSPGQPVKNIDTGAEVIVLGRSNREIKGRKHTRFDKCDYFKISIGGKSFFVKRSFITINPGFTEFQNVIKAQEVLKDLDFVKVIDAKLGYQDKKESWYISEWNELEKVGFGSWDPQLPIDDYGQIKLNRESPEYATAEFYEWEQENKLAQKKVDQIVSKLEEKDIHNDLEANLFYNPESKTFILLDVTDSIMVETLGNPLPPL